MNIGELIHHWLTGKVSDTELLYGIPIFWWSRGAKLLQFVSGLAVLIDIIGVEKVKERGERLRKTFSAKTLFGLPTYLKNQGKIIALNFEELIIPNDEPKDEIITVGDRVQRVIGTRSNPNYYKNADRQRRRKEVQEKKETLKKSSPYSSTTYNLIGLGGIIVTIFVTDKEIFGVNKWFLIIPFSLFIILIANAIIYILIIFIYKLPYLILEFLLFEPIGYILSRKKFKDIIVRICFILFILGTMFDMLLS